MSIITNSLFWRILSGKFTTLLLIQVFTIQLLFGQNKKPVFQSLPQGSYNQSIQCILKDGAGFMWFGTKDGLIKYDGSNFTVYENNPEDTCSLSHNSINALIEDNKHNIWIGTSDGLNQYNRAADNFTRIKFQGIEKIYISSLCAGDNGNLWIGTFGIGLVLYNYQTLLNKSFRTANSSINSNIITSILIDKQRHLWIGTRNGLNLFNPAANSFQSFIHTNSPGSISNNLISTLFTDRQGNLWIGTMGGGLNKLPTHKTTFIFQHYNHLPGSLNNSNNIVMSIAEDKNGNIWTGTENEGLNCLNTTNGTIDNYHTEEGNPRSLNSNSITALYFDGEILWIGTYNQGINFLDNKYEKFELFQKSIFSKNTIQDNDVTGFAEDKSGNIWIATDGGGICYFDIASKNVTKIITGENARQLINNNIQTIICDRNENLWVATWAGGIDRLDKAGHKIKNYKVEGILKTGDNKIITLRNCKDNTILAGTAGSGLFRYDRATDRFVQVIDTDENIRGADIEFVTAILEDTESNLWIGTLYGLVKMTRQANHKFLFSKYYADRNPKTINSNRITVIFEDSKKNIWFGTEDKGLTLFNREKNSYAYFQKKDGLPGNSIKGILEDKNGNLWISTNKGVSKFQTELVSFKNYTKNDGLNSDEFYRNSCLVTTSGEFFLGGNNGFNMFHPNNITVNIFIPPIYFTDFKVFNKSLPVKTEGSPLSCHISLTKSITLAYNQNSFSIDYVALNYTRSSQNQYSYILEGLENDWNHVGNRLSASYTNINPGKYVFKVMGSNNDGIWNSTPVSLEIIVLPPLWRTFRAYILYFLLISGILYTFIRLIVTRAKQRQILSLNQMKLNFFTNISHELRTPLTLILSPLENMISSTKIDYEVKSQLSLIYRNAGRLFRLVNELMDFSKAEESELKILVQPGDIVKFTHELFDSFNDEAFRRQISFQFISKQDSLEVWFDRDKLEKIILNLLSNAFKFTPDEGKISVGVDVADSGTEQFVKIIVTDNGTGISQKYIDKVFDRFYQVPEDNSLVQRGTGIGLALAKNLVELHHGRIEVTSEQFKGTCFSVFLPMGNAHFKQNEIRKVPIDINAAVTLAGKEERALPAASQNSNSILLVEDNFELRKYLADQLSARYNILEAENGEEGFNIALKEIPDIIISDVMMPKISGIELCKKIKEELTTSHIPVILLTAKITLEEKIEGIEIGADAYITKPFNIRFLEVSVKNLIETRRKLFQRFSQEVFILPKELGNTPVDQDFLERAIAFVEKNISKENLTVEELASHLLLSHSQTYRKIKALTGQSVNGFIRTIRLKISIKLMQAGKLTISEISYKVGFTSPAYFTKCFREQFGKPPSEYLPES